MLSRRTIFAAGGTALFGSAALGRASPARARVARVWRGRTLRETAQTYDAYMRAEGIPALARTALGVQFMRQDLADESWFMVVSYWADVAAMAAFTGGEPTKVHDLPRDRELLIELPSRIEIYRLLIDR